MNQYCGIQQNGVASYEEMRSSVAVCMPDRRDSVVCPKPRRVGVLNGTINDSPRPIRWHFGNQADIADSKAGSELLDLIFAKGSNRGGVSDRSCAGTNRQVASSPPFFCGSPPSRVSNPLIQDARFKEEEIIFPPPVSSPLPVPFSMGGMMNSPSGQSSSSPSSARKGGGCVRSNFGNNPAVRIEGFDCLDRDRSRNCSIPAFA